MRVKCTKCCIIYPCLLSSWGYVALLALASSHEISHPFVGRACSHDYWILDVVANVYSVCDYVKVPWVGTGAVCPDRERDRRGSLGSYSSTPLWPYSSANHSLSDFWTFLRIPCKWSAKYVCRISGAWENVSGASLSDTCFE
ncbi:hypothetical protein FKP32DRAFT_1207511 [Trametes sanguinea]|nr:hypothetical protein FKP32DRAFT_1207511 [Trametes sanguinea]